jgi:hypothetical protein
MEREREVKRPKRPCRYVQRPNESELEEPAGPGADWVSPKIPDNLDEIILNWASYAGPSKVGWCFLCDQPILSEDDLIPGTATHRCDAGWRIEREYGGA